MVHLNFLVDKRRTGILMKNNFGWFLFVSDDERVRNICESFICISVQLLHYFHQIDNNYFNTVGNRWHKWPPWVGRVALENKQLINNAEVNRCHTDQQIKQLLQLYSIVFFKNAIFVTYNKYIFIIFNIWQPS